LVVHVTVAAAPPATPQTDEAEHPARLARRRVPSRGGHAVSVTAKVLAVVVPVAVGVQERVWFLLSTPINSDQAVVGLMARAILDGHPTALFWGQPYGGVEPYLVAPTFWVLGQSALTLNLVPVLLSVVTAVLVWRIGLRLVHDRFLALMAGVVVFAAPETSTYLSALEYGFRGVTLAAGLVVLLGALRVLDGRRSWWDLGLLGLATGIGWWSSPEIVYFVLPGTLLVAGAVALDVRTRRPDGRRPGPAWVATVRLWLPRLSVALGAAAVGAAPWLWNNAGHHWRSIKRSSIASAGAPTAYGAHLGNFFHQALAVTLGLSSTRTQAPVLAQPWDLLVWTLAVAAALAAAVCCVARGGRAVVLVVAVVAFPFLWAYSPDSWSTQTAAYGVYLPPLLVLMGLVGVEEGAARWARRGTAHHRTPRPGRAVRQWAMIAVAAVLTTTAAWSFQVQHASQSLHDITGSGATVASRGSGPGGPNALAVQAADAFLRAGIHTGFASYWVAYKLDFLSGAGAPSGLLLSPVSTSTCRNRAILRAVNRSPDPAWVFTDPAHVAAAVSQYLNIPVVLQGAGQEALSLFAGNLQITHAHATQVVRAGALEAVVPSRRITQTMVAFAPTSACRVGYTSAG